MRALRVSLLATVVGLFLLGLKQTAIVLLSTAITMGGTTASFLPEPPPQSLSSVQNRLQGTGVEPVTSVNDVNYNRSYFPLGLTAFDPVVANGSDKFDDAVQSTPGDIVAVGDSLGSIAISEWLKEHANDPDAPAADRMTVVLFGDQENPDGGLFTLAPGLSFLGFTFRGPTPQTQYKTFIVSRQYDGFADAPDKLWNLVADINALMGIAYVHPDYSNVTADPNDPRNMVKVDGNITYIVQHTDHLPLLQPLRDLLKLIGRTNTPLLDEIEERIIRPIVDAGYDRSGYSTPAAPPVALTETPVSPSIQEETSVQVQRTSQSVVDEPQGNSQQSVTVTSSDSSDTVAVQHELVTKPDVSMVDSNQPATLPQVESSDSDKDAVPADNSSPTTNTSAQDSPSADQDSTPSVTHDVPKKSKRSFNPKHLQNGKKVEPGKSATNSSVDAKENDSDTPVGHESVSSSDDSSSIGNPGRRRPGHAKSGSHDADNGSGDSDSHSSGAAA